jgi:hypothetical protein
VVFARDTTAGERVRIAARCPSPMLGAISWAPRFVYLGSAGDDFDLTVIATHGGPRCDRLVAWRWTAGARTISYFDRAISMARVAGDPDEVVALGEQAITATGDPELADKAAKAARSLGNARGAKALAASHAALKASSAAVQSADLARCEAHLERGGAFTIDLLANTAVLYRRVDAPDPAKIATHVERMRGLLLREVAFGFGAGLSFAVMACVHGHHDAAIDVLDELLDRGLWHNSDVLWALADAGHRSADMNRKRRVAARVTPLLSSIASPFASAYLARIHVALGDLASAIQPSTRRAITTRSSPSFTTTRRSARCAVIPRSRRCSRRNPRRSRRGRECFATGR